eukprot:TRINITY_DN76792_c0_g1_i1.p1 TRINITY_DN76792_c0_g1~~TRINITY_DN76792_c0_g1_i1.p1  ORF type:complete len:377 (-),score=48.29 TRINITY_DN76792_c0_g1_i1:107-1237(-)
MNSLTLADLYAKSPAFVDRAFLHLDFKSLTELQAALGVLSNADVTSRIIGTAILRRRVHKCLDKMALFGSVDAGLAHTLPIHLRKRIVELYGGAPPTTWRDALSRLEELAAGSRDMLWQSVIEHPMTEYVPNQCHHCGQLVPDESIPGSTDAEVGLSEERPTEAELPFVRGGYYRGPRDAVVFVFRCAACNEVSRWFRSSAAEIILNPNRWGRLCTEQEDLRAALASYLRVPLRAAVPLDWDHVWSETMLEDGSWVPNRGPSDAPTADMAARLDEGIGAWTRILVICSDPFDTGDVTDEYLQCVDGPRGRASSAYASSMPRFRQIVEAARGDSTGALTQFKTVNGFILRDWSAAEVTATMRRAVQDHGSKDWWEFD